MPDLFRDYTMDGSQMPADTHNHNNGDSLDPMILPQDSTVLIVDDEEINRRLLSGICKKAGITAHLAENGQDALEKSANQDFSIYFVDLRMPVMSGYKFISELQKIKDDPVVIVITSMDDPAIIIRVMKLNVFDYLIKPVEHNRVIALLRKAQEYRALKEREKSRTQTIIEQLRNRAEWLDYRIKRNSTSGEVTEKNLIHNLLASMSQGQGIGSLLTSIQLLENTLQPENGEYRIHEDLVKFLFKNATVAMQSIEGLKTILEIFDSEPCKSIQPAETLIEFIQDKAEELNDYTLNRGIKISITPPSNSRNLNMDSEQLRLVLEEILINAIKYSRLNGQVDIYTGLTESYFAITIKNDVERGSRIPEDRANLLVDPFFRLIFRDDPVAEKERFGLGLGLTMAEHIVKQHGGLLSLHNGIDNTRNPPVNCVFVEIFLPRTDEVLSDPGQTVEVG